MKNFITYLSLTLIGVGALLGIMEIKRKRRRLLEEKKPYNKVSQDFGGMVPSPLYRYLRSLGGEGRIKRGTEFWGYGKILEYSRSILKSMEGDVLMILGINRELSDELGKTVYLMYSKSGYPDNLILTIHNPETGSLEYYKNIDFSVLS